MATKIKNGVRVELTTDEINELNLLQQKAQEKNKKRDSQKQMEDNIRRKAVKRACHRLDITPEEFDLILKNGVL
jgi:hypothetical protein